MQVVEPYSTIVTGASIAPCTRSGSGPGAINWSIGAMVGVDAVGTGALAAGVAVAVGVGVGVAAVCARAGVNARSAASITKAGTSEATGFTDNWGGPGNGKRINVMTRK